MTRNLFLFVLFMYQSSADSNCLWASESTPCPECVRGWHGVHCDKRCIGVCDSGGCHRDSGKCLQCQGGYYSSNCTRKCPLRCSKDRQGQTHCNRTTAHCLEHCEDGWLGDRCDRPCSEGCVDNSCYSWDGTCNKGCRHGWTGDDCGTRCPSGCRHNACEPSGKGRCTKGCNHGFHGHHCDRPCDSRCRGRECVYDHEVKSAVCTEGCVDGWMSSDCKKKCPPNCQACLQESGHCSRCSHGYWGVDCANGCSSTCSERTCDEDGRCFACQSGYYGNTCESYCGTDCTICEMKNTDGVCDDVCAALCLNNSNGTRGSPSAVQTCERNTSDRCGEEFLLPLVTVLFLNICFAFVM
ncbi:scavenger receptor class F member 1-like isoform X2 [Haliotis rubra]|uniref:scavenger receptor class F member 1-like isoform X2 n=1 Tax=Haliotis rubra TaxID=36100 RepID=UPI001EE5F4CB|nr:scavenger receptor class F member 1-like isoform X2 [Haliotis rubra]